MSAGLVGRFFHTWALRPEDDDDNTFTTRRGDRILEYQGHVVDRESENVYIVELFSFWDGAPNGQKVATLEEMREWTFYDSALEMQAALNCRESTRDDGYCGRPVEYATDIALGVSTVCARCASTYSYVRRITWENGKPVGLGERETLKHWLSPA